MDLLPADRAPHLARIPGVVARRRSRSALVILGLGAGLLASMGLALAQGAVDISAGHMLAIFLQPFPIDLPWEVVEREAVIVLSLRLPRVLMAALIGAGLSVAGATMQGLFRNPLAEPGLVGVSSGAALGAVSVIVLGGTAVARLPAALGIAVLPAAAFVGGLVVTTVVYKLATREGRTNVATMLLAGVAISALAGAGTSLLTYLADDTRLRDVIFWTMGSLGGATWTSVGIGAVLILCPLLAAMRLGRALNALLLGEAEAFHLGIGVEWVKRWIVLFSSVAVGAAVALSGIIGFVGLVVPHMFRIAVGPDNRTLLPGSALLGAVTLILADLLARTVISPAELPIGILTAAAGAPFFLWLLVRDRRRAYYL